MNKTVVYAVGVVALLGAGYVGASWYAGQKIGTQLQANALALSKYPIIKVVKRDYTAGLFSAEENITYRIGCADGLGEEHPLQGVMGTVSLKNTISHQPFDMTVDTAIQYDEKTKQALAKIFKQETPLSIKTKLEMGGDFKTKFAVPAFSVNDPDGQLNVKAMNASIESDQNLSFFDAKMQHGGFSLDAKSQQIQWTMGEINYEAESKKTELGIYEGTGKMTLGAFALNSSNQGKPVQLNFAKFKFSTDTKVKQGLVDTFFKGEIEQLGYNGKEIGSLNVDYAINHLDGKALQNINQASLNDLLQCNVNPTAQMKNMTEQLKIILANDPKFTQKMSLKAAEGEAKFDLSFASKGLLATDFAKPMLALNKVNAVIDIKVPQPLIERFIREMAGVEAENSLAMFQQSLGMGIGQGYVVSDGKLIQTNLILDQGKMVLNGKLIDPMQMLSGGGNGGQ